MYNSKEVERSYISNSEEETEKIGEMVMEEFKDVRIFLLEGELGSGKTVMVRGMVKALGGYGTVRSPSFVVVKEYKLDDICVHHIDLYRIEDDFENAGLFDSIQSGCYIFVEWGEKVRKLLKGIPHVYIRIEDMDVTKRRIEVEYSGG